MKSRTLSLAVLAMVLGACATSPAAPVAAPAPVAPPAAAVPEVYFAPPPVPSFMLQKPARPLTIEEMQQQADEASQRARQGR